MGLIKERQDYQHAGNQKDEYSSDEVIVVPCPLCGSNDREPVFREHGAIVVSRCRACSLLYTSPRYKAPEQIYWGTLENYYEEARLVFEGRAPHHRDPNYLEELEFVRRHKPSGRFLDVGCHCGWLLRHVRDMGWTGVGVEPSPTLAKLASERLGLDVYNCFLHELPKHEVGAFDVIALSDVFEHITEPVPFLQEAARYLAPDGVLYIKVPNARWNLFKQRMLKAFGRVPRQGIWDSYEHVVHYTDRTLAAMLNRAGFEVVAMTIGKPIQGPIWHEHVGKFYQYPSPWYMDWKRHLGRAGLYWLSWPERVLRLGRIGWFAPNLVALARTRPA